MCVCVGVLDRNDEDERGLREEEDRTDARGGRVETTSHGSLALSRLTCGCGLTWVRVDLIYHSATLGASPVASPDTERD